MFNILTVKQLDYALLLMVISQYQ